MTRDRAKKYVMVFTDGASNGPGDLIKEAEELHKVADRTYALGIGSGIDENELREIASSDTYVGKMTDFAQLDAFVRKFVLGGQNGCKTNEKKPHRIKVTSYVCY